jgi:hypothetical protein
MSKPIALSDTQMDTIVRLAGPLPPQDRDVYLREVAAALDGREEIGDGLATATADLWSCRVRSDRSCSAAIRMTFA